MSLVPIWKTPIQSETDVIQARKRAHQIAARLGFGVHDQTRIATAVLEVARNAIQHAKGGLVEFLAEGDPARTLHIRVIDQGPGFHENRVVTGGLAGARRLMDRLQVVANTPRGTIVTLARTLTQRVAGLTAVEVSRFADELSAAAPPDPYEELRRQNRELLRVLDDLRARELELLQINRELEDTNRGVLALHKELDERAESLKKAGDMKTRFLANISHEFRTPLTSILSIARLLIDRTDGDLLPEQERQVSFILRAGQDLTGLINDLLDLARIEAGREVVRAEPFSLESLFGSLRGMLRPLIAPGSPVELHVADVSDLPTLSTDEAKLAQILRNFLSNALKFTERGEVRLEAELVEPASVRFVVRDTGIGIAPENLERIFEEFGQVDSVVQRRVKGTGLGLPLTRKLAGLLGGTVGVDSELDVGSTFWAVLPIELPTCDNEVEDGPDAQQRGARA